MELYYKKGKRYYSAFGGVPMSCLINDRMMKEGLWLVTGEGNHKQWVSQITELPSHPAQYAGIMCNNTDLADFIGHYRNEYGKQRDTAGWAPSNQELSLAILNFLAKRAGIAFSRELPKTMSDERRIDLDL